MKNTFYPLLLISSLLLSACSEEESSTQHDITINSTNNTKINKSVKITIPTTPSKVYDFNLSNAKEEFSLLQVQENIYTFSNIAEPIILVNFFSTWCPPCRGQLPHLNNLQEKYKNQVFIMGLLVHDDIEPQQLNTCITSQKVNYFISNKQTENQKFANFIAPKLKLKSNFNLPLMIIFVKGKYYTHYLGTVPEEMIESDIKQALNQTEGSK